MVWDTHSYYIQLAPPHILPSDFKSLSFLVTLTLGTSTPPSIPWNCLYSFSHIEVYLAHLYTIAREELMVAFAPNLFS